MHHCLLDTVHNPGFTMWTSGNDDIFQADNIMLPPSINLDTDVVKMVANARRPAEILDSFNIQHSTEKQRNILQTILLCHSVKNRRLQLSRYLLENGFKPDYTCGGYAYGKGDVYAPFVMPIYIAVTNQDMDHVLLLLQYNANVNMSSIDGSVETDWADTPIGVAIKQDNLDMMKIMLPKYDPSLTQEHYYPLHYAVKYNSRKCFYYLLSLGDVDLGLDADTVEGTPLCLAIQHGLELTQALIRHGANPAIGYMQPIQRIRVRRLGPDYATIARSLILAGANVIVNKGHYTVFEHLVEEVRGLFPPPDDPDTHPEIRNPRIAWQSMLEGLIPLLDRHPWDEKFDQKVAHGMNHAIRLYKRAGFGYEKYTLSAVHDIHITLALLRTIVHMMYKGCPGGDLISNWVNRYHLMEIEDSMKKLRPYTDGLMEFVCHMVVTEGMFQCWIGEKAWRYLRPRQQKAHITYAFSHIFNNLKGYMDFCDNYLAIFCLSDQKTHLSKLHAAIVKEYKAKGERTVEYENMLPPLQESMCTLRRQCKCVILAHVGQPVIRIKELPVPNAIQAYLSPLPLEEPDFDYHDAPLE